MFKCLIIYGRKGPSRGQNPKEGDVCAQSYINHILKFIAPNFAIHNKCLLIQDSAH
jgi:hypothetical protein